MMEKCTKMMAKTLSDGRKIMKNNIAYRLYKLDMIIALQF